MRTQLFVIALLFVIIGCSSQEKTNTNEEYITFRIYETLKGKDVQKEILDKLDSYDVHIEDNKELANIGYVLKTDSTNLEQELLGDSLSLLRTVYTVDEKGLYNVLVMVRSTPGIVNSDIAKTKNIGNNVEIRFTMKGAKKWAELVQKNLGNQIAFVINDQVYSLPEVNAKIDNGSAIISGLTNEAVAKDISALLNKSIGK